MELIMITRSKKLVASDPPEGLLSGHYMKFDSEDDPGSFLLFSRSGKVYKVRKKDLKDAIEEGYVRG